MKREMNKLMLFAMISIFLIGLVSAVSNDEISYFYKTGESFDVKRECFFNGAPCNVTIFMCYLTTYYPNQTILLNGSVMSGQTNFYNKTFYDTTYPLGIYRNSMYCTDGINSGSEIFYFMVNQTGDNRNDTLFLILVLGSVIILGFGILFQNEYIGFISGSLFIITGVYVMIYGFANLSDMYTRSISYVSIGLGLIFSIAAGYKVAEETGITDGGIFTGDNWE
jgi:hypothetical protein